MHVRSVAVFCGSRPGLNPAWLAAARQMGAGLARARIRLIYGGGRIGLMGELADAVLQGGGTVLGVIPEFLTAMEVAHEGLTKLAVTDSMHSRKRLMFDHADAFITLPGGLGTLDETVEMITWRQLGLHSKPVLICNVEGWADGLLAAFRHAIDDGFASETATGLYEIHQDVDAVLARLESMAASAGADSARL